jgi:nitrate/TMAO reductase-like tetraheme cytochrome c subunit
MQDWLAEEMKSARYDYEQEVSSGYRQENSSCCESCHMMTSMNIRDKSDETAGPLPLTCRSEFYSLTGL